VSIRIEHDDTDPPALVETAGVRATVYEPVMRAVVARGASLRSLILVSVDASDPEFEWFCEMVAGLTGARAGRVIRQARRDGYCTVVLPRDAFLDASFNENTPDAKDVRAWSKGLPPDALAMLHVHADGYSHYPVRFDPPAVSGKN